MSNLRACICCHKEYEYCPNCGKYQNLPSWMAIFHDANCRLIFRTATDYEAHNITDDQAREILDTCDLSRRELFIDSIQKMLDKLYPPKVEIMPKPEVAEPKETEQPLVRKKIKIKGGQSRQ